MLRASWTGSISFGLVSIPVKAVPAQTSKDISFEQLHSVCHTKPSSKRYCNTCEREVPSEEMVRGFQYAKGQYVLLTPEEIESANTPAKKTIHILDFVDIWEVDPVYYEKPYYLTPSEGGDRTYALLLEGMRETGKVGVGKVALRDRESLALIRPMGHALVMEILAFPDEVRTVEEAVPPINVELDPRELKMAETLIDSLTASWEPTKYHDEYRDNLTRIIEQKVEGGTVTLPTTPAPASEGVNDLMEILRRSVEAAGGSKAPEAEAEPAEKASASKAAKDDEPAPAEAREPAAAGARRRGPRLAKV